jgi:hypothetical protein
MGIDREKLGCEIRRIKGGGMWRWRNGKCNGLFRNQGSISYGNLSFKRLYYTTYYITDDTYYNRPTPTPRDEALTS